MSRLEYLARVQGVNIFNEEALKVDHYGTLEDPILVETVSGERIVGCTGKRLLKTTCVALFPL